MSDHPENAIAPRFGVLSYIPLGATHWMGNLGKPRTVLIKVQTSSYQSEDVYARS